MVDRDEYQEHWRARDPERNIARVYHLSVSIDLFGWTIVDRHWGRIGTAGQSRRESFRDIADAERLIASVRRRRASAQKRIGVPYKRIDELLPQTSGAQCD